MSTASEDQQRIGPHTPAPDSRPDSKSDSQPDSPHPPSPPPGEEQPAPEPLPPAQAVDTGVGGLSPWQALSGGLWAAATSAWLAPALSVLLALLLGLTWVLPQLPGQLDSEAGAADRWLTAAAAARGALGATLRSLGLFQIMQSAMLQLLLGLLIFVLLVQLARFGLAAYTLHAAANVLDRPGGVNGEPLPIAAAGTLWRWRRAHPAPPLNLAGELQRLLDARMRHVERRTVRVAPATLAAEAGAPGDPADAPTLEERLLAVRAASAAWLRPLLLLGMLAAVSLMWANATFGWEYTADQLPPGERTADAIHDLRFEYRIDEAAPGVLQPALVASVGGETAIIPVEQEMQEQIGSVLVRAQPSAPGLIVQTVNGDLLLARPGQVTPVSSIGLGFPSAGSEETLLLPQQAAGLRLVRVEGGAPGPAGDGFLLEVFQGGSEQAVLRREITGSEILSIPTATGTVVLAMTPLPNLAVQVRHSPVQWLLWVALALSLAGLPGFWQQPGFVLVQVGPWPPERAVVTVQSDLAAEMDSLKRWYSESAEGGSKEL